MLKHSFIKYNIYIRIKHLIKYINSSHFLQSTCNNNKIKIEYFNFNEYEERINTYLSCSALIKKIRFCKNVSS